VTPAAKRVRAGPLDIAYEESGPADGQAVLLLHGFPYDPRAFDAVAPVLAAQGLRVIIPYLRGFGPTRFVDADAMRSGEQAALADDLRALIDALDLPSVLLAGFDWGGRAACIVAALWPERVRGLLAIGGYLIQDPDAMLAPLPPALEQRLWHQYFLASPRGRVALERNRGALCRHFCESWSPGIALDEAAFAASALSFDNPDFVDVVVHSYAHRIGMAAGDPLYAPIQARLAGRPPITVPAIVLRGGAAPLGGSAANLSDLLDDRAVAGAGHNPAGEQPEAVVAALLDLDRSTANR
jgi:pimeloyl-ACP methyl ester carboxylesterase